jgi:hypothetical protein
MPVPLRRFMTAVAALAAATAAVSSSPATAARPLTTAIVDPAAFTGPAAPLAFSRAGLSGASVVRLAVLWGLVAPRRPVDTTDPADPSYDWGTLDSQVRLAREGGLEPIISINFAPLWAYEPLGDGRYVPDPAQLGAFARAVAERYSGRFGGLPRVRYWQVWNEPNITLYLAPQFLNGKPFSPGHYREMVNGVSAAVKAVNPDNVVIAGGTAPFRDTSSDVRAVNPRWGPLTFMREFLCLNADLTKKCDERVQFDVWSTHPYTSGGPTHHANLPDDVSLGDLPEMKVVLDAGVRAGNIVPGTDVRFWVTEFSWDSAPPDPKGVPAGLHTRWVAEALYRMWLSGVSLVTWFQLVDDPLTQSFYQSGLYYRGATPAQDRPKPALTAFRFPFVGLPRNGGTFVWGRTPAGKPGSVLVEQSFKGGWKKLGTLKTDRYGIFQKRFKSKPVGSVRARLAGRPERAVPFSLKPVPDRFFNPFGQETILEPPA